MIKCPNCGLTTLIQIIDHDTYIWNNTISIYITYRCGCGRGFVTRTEIDKANEKMYEEEI